jgi:hypothetical protein
MLQQSFVGKVKPIVMLTNKGFWSLLLFVALLAASCSSGSRAMGKKGCGCPQKQGMIGY